MTAQIHEGLMLDGEEVSMAFCPPLPEGHPRLYERYGDEVQQRDVGPKSADALTDAADVIVLRSTACWRGYRGTWEVKDGRFYLIGLRGRFRLHEGGPILADWFSGVLRVPKGEQLQYVHMGFGSVYEQEIHIKVKHGLVVATRVIDNREKKHDEWNIG